MSLAQVEGILRRLAHKIYLEKENDLPRLQPPLYIDLEEIKVKVPKSNPMVILVYIRIGLPDPKNTIELDRLDGIFESFRLTKKQMPS